MNVSLTPQLEDHVKSKVASGLYNNASEVVRESLRLMLERDQAKERLKTEVANGFAQIEKGQTTRIESEEKFLNIARENRA
ncbi:MAG: type II toxin-antitoxin system ParD family antitoxin [Akkermansiaceae bacterium]